MSLRLGSLAILAALVAVSCAPGKMKVKKGEPQTAREKMLAEEKAKAKRGEGDAGEEPMSGKKRSKWRYQGERESCFFLVGQKCFKTEKAACQAAKCKAPSTCETEGAGPAAMTCSSTATPDDKDGDKDTGSDKDKVEDKTEPPPKKKSKSRARSKAKS